jgi:hypothetical protein
MSQLSDLKVGKGSVLTADLWNALVENLELLMEGPDVVAPLYFNNGAIGLGQDYQSWVCKTTGTITARSGSQWGNGLANFYTVDANGVESIMPGFAQTTVWNYFGAPIASGIRVEVSWTYERWVIEGGDCSGNP